MTLQGKNKKCVTQQATPSTAKFQIRVEQALSAIGLLINFVVQIIQALIRPQMKDKGSRTIHLSQTHINSYR